MVSTLSHIRAIERVALGKAILGDAPVVQSWLRCPKGYRLDSTVAQEA